MEIVTSLSNPLNSLLDIVVEQLLNIRYFHRGQLMRKYVTNPNKSLYHIRFDNVLTKPQNLNNLFAKE